MKFIFFTDYSTQISKYCLLNVKKYKDISKLDKIMYFIDPSVYELKDSNEYSNIKLLEHLSNAGNLKENEFISIDYPNDMNPQYSDLFIEKTMQYNKKYADNLNYIATLQFKFKDFNDFRQRFNELSEYVDMSKKVIGIGNLCRIMSNNDFIDNVFDFLYNQIKIKQIAWIHFYGLSKRVIEVCINKFKDLNSVIISTDSTKWTRRVHKNPPLDKAICCRKENRDVYFTEYIKAIEKKTNHKILY